MQQNDTPTVESPESEREESSSAQVRTKKEYVKPGGAWRPVFIHWLSVCGTPKIAAEKAGVSRRTAYQHRKDDAEFAEEWEDALQRWIDGFLFQASVCAMGKKGDAENPPVPPDPVMLRWFLERKRRDEYAPPTQKIEHTGEAVRVEIRVVSEGQCNAAEKRLAARVVEQLEGEAQDQATTSGG